MRQSRRPDIAGAGDIKDALDSIRVKILSVP
jgi:hypothetical protein